MLKKISLSFLMIFMLFTSFGGAFISVCAKDSDYQIYDFSEDKYITSFNSLKQANEFYDDNTEKYLNLGIKLNDDIFKIEYGIGNFKSDDCTVNIDYYNSDTKSAGYTNACYGLDAAYIETTDKSRVNFLLAGANGYADLGDVEIVEYKNDGNDLLSYFYIEDEYLYHKIYTATGSNNIRIDFNNYDYFDEDIKYYSYDNHYFYDDYYLLVDDLRNETHDNAVNSDDCYFNYYLYLPNRSYTNYTTIDLESYFYDYLKIDKSINKYSDQDKNSVNDYYNMSQYYNKLNDFMVYQNEYGANAMLMLVISMNETAYGKSALSYNRNNLFGHAAYDSDVEKNAKRYLDVSSSIASHAKNYISNSYSNQDKYMYHGSFLGDKGSGMNVSYASDPYWSIKAASFYFRFDEKNGLKDKDFYSFAITSQLVDVYSDVILEELLYTYQQPNMSYIILEQIGDVIKVQLDTNFSEELNYDITKNIGYIKLSQIDNLINNGNIINYQNITYDALDGSFKNNETIKHLNQNSDDAICEIPIKQGFVFDKWIKSDIGYSASYLKVVDYKLINMDNIILEINEKFDLSNMYLEFTLEDESKHKLPINTSMISNFDISVANDYQGSVQYQGISDSFDINISDDLDTLRNQMSDDIENILLTYENVLEFDDEALNELLTLKQTIMDNFSPYLKIDTIIKMDKIYQNAFGSNFSTIMNDESISISGINFSVDYKMAIDKVIFKDTLFINKNEIDDSNKQLFEGLINYNNLKEVEYFNLELLRNSFINNSFNHFVVSVKVDNLDPNLKYVVYGIDDGDIIQYSSQQGENTISFKANSFTDYGIFAYESNNVYISDDVIGNISIENNGFDYTIVIKIVASIIVFLILVIFILLIIKRKRGKHASNKNRNRKHKV